MKTQACMQDILQESLAVSRKSSEDVEKLTDTAKAQLDEQRESMITIKKDMQEAILNAVQELREEIKNTKMPVNCDESEVKLLAAENQKLKSEAVHKDEQIRQLETKLQANELQIQECAQKVQDQKQMIEDSNHKEVLLTEYVKELSAQIRDQKQELEESHRKEVQLKEDVRELKSETEIVNRIITANSFCKKKENVKQLVQGIQVLYAGNFLGQGLGKLLEESTDASSQLEKVLQSDDNPLWAIGSDGYVELASLLLCGGLPVDKEATMYGDHMLHAAAKGGQLKMATLLLLHGADVDSKRSYDSSTPLMWAASFGQLEMAKYLVRAGADVSVQNIYGKTALGLARDFNNKEIIKFLESV